MGITEFVRSVKPRDDRFFDVLEAHGALLGAAGGSVLALGSRAATFEAALDAVRGLEPSSAERLGQLESLLGSTYVTPLERSDLHALGQSIHESILTLEVALAALVALGDRRSSSRLDAQVRHVGELLTLVAAQVPLVREGGYRRIVSARRDFRGLERSADGSFRSGVRDLFDADEAPPSTIVREYAAHERLAVATSTVSRTGAHLRMVALKHA